MDRFLSIFFAEVGGKMRCSRDRNSLPTPGRGNEVFAQDELTFGKAQVTGKPEVKKRIMAKR